MNGCETSLTTLTDCGNCAQPCDLANASASCASGNCTIGVCAAGFGDCDGNPIDGCETSLTTLTDCGDCSQPCDLANASESCASGTCTLGVCAAGFDDCDGVLNNGCETDLQTTAAHCGACGVACSGAATCVGGACKPASCVAGGSGAGLDCGPGNNKDCCGSPLVTGGTFKRSYDGVTYLDQGYPATLSDFRLDTYEITVGRFRKFVEAGKGTQAGPPAAGDGAHPSIAGSGWDPAWNPSLPVNESAQRAALKCSATYQTWTDSAAGNERRALNCMSWFDAFAFCAWDGGRLATEAERNYAAAGGSEQRVYPWSVPPSSTTIDCTYANSCGSVTNVGSTSPKGDGKWGQADLGADPFLHRVFTRLPHDMIHAASLAGFAS